MKAIFTILVILFATLSLSLPAHAQVYRWVDEEGNVHFTDQPPPGKNAEHVEVKVTKSDVSNQQIAEQRREQLKALESSRKELAKSRATTAADKRDRKQKCAAARERSDHLAWQRKIHEVDAQGNKTYLSDADEDRVKQEARDAVTELCD